MTSEPLFRQFLICWYQKKVLGTAPNRPLVGGSRVRLAVLFRAAHHPVDLMLFSNRNNALPQLLVLGLGGVCWSF
jgi:hypothetical protein